MFWKALQTVTKGWRAELVITYYNKGCIPLPRQKIPSALCMSWVPGLRRTSGPSIVSDIFLGTSRRYLTMSSYCNLCEFDVPTSGQKQIYCHSWRSLSITGSCSWVRGKWSRRSTDGLEQCQQWCGLCSGEERPEHERKTVDSLVELCSYTHLAVVSERIRLWIQALEISLLLWVSGLRDRMRSWPFGTQSFLGTSEYLRCSSRVLSRKRTWDTPRICFQLAQKCLCVPLNVLEEVAGKRKVWMSLLRLLPLNPDKQW